MFGRSVPPTSFPSWSDLYQPPEAPVSHPPEDIHPLISVPPNFSLDAIHPLISVPPNFPPQALVSHPPDNDLNELLKTIFGSLFGGPLSTKPFGQDQFAAPSFNPFGSNYPMQQPLGQNFGNGFAQFLPNFAPQQVFPGGLPIPAGLQPGQWPSASQFGGNAHSVGAETVSHGNAPGVPIVPNFGTPAGSSTPVPPVPVTPVATTGTVQAKAQAPPA